MRKRDVYFEANPRDLTDRDYISAQESWQQEQLTAFVSELQAGGRIDHSDARLLENGRWSLWIRSEGRDPVNHVCYIGESPANEHSALARSILNPIGSPKATRSVLQGRRLVIESGLPSRDSIGGVHPGFWTVEDYSSRLDEVQREIFDQVITAIRTGATSRYYSVRDENSYQIEIDRPDLGYGIHIRCIARWE